MANDSAKFQIDITRDPGVIEQIGLLRKQVWTEMGAQFIDPLKNKNPWLDALDFSENTYNLVAYVNGEIVGGGRLSLHDNIDMVSDSGEFSEFRSQLKHPCAMLRRMFVLGPYRQMGIGSALDKKRIEIAEGLGVKTILGAAVGEKRSRGLLKLGFTVLAVKESGHNYIVPNSHFYFMMLQLK